MFPMSDSLENKNPLFGFINREKAYLKRQQLLSLIYYVLQISIVTVIFMPKAVATSRYFFIGVLGTLQIVALFSLIGYIKRKLRLSTSLRIIMYSVQTIVSAQLVHISVNNVELLTGFHKTLIMSNITMMILNVALSIIACQKNDPLILSVISLLVYGSCAVITGDHWFRVLATVIVTMFLLLGFLGTSLVWSTRRIQRENQTLKQEDDAMFALFNLTREQVKAYVKLADQEMSDDKILAVFDILGKRAQRNVYCNMKRYYYAKQFSEEAIGRAFPMLSQSEREICRLVLQDKKLGDICHILDKNESNITTTRSNIRKKLGLSPADDLKVALQRKMDSISSVREPLSAKNSAVESD